MVIEFLSVKQLLMKQLNDAYSLNEEMSFKVSVANLTQEEASWQINGDTWSIEQIIFHIASSVIEYCKQGFGTWDKEYDKPIDDISSMIDLSDKAFNHLMEQITSLDDFFLFDPIDTKSHGESGAHFFWMMIMHYITHAAQIRTIRRAYGPRTDYYPI